ncbi:MAG: hypothetical protein B7Z66_10280 [Chromatiales bacterium 21-64-14]|nr:MAG: hypothetical protein B7Z66_10280 [Chromatiales bacterium 21-64-14]
MLLFTGDGVGDVNGSFVLARLAAFLHFCAQADSATSLRLREPVVIFPAGAGSHPTRALAAGIPYRIRIRSPDPGLEELPQVRLYGPADDERADACLFGLPAVVEYPPIQPDGNPRFEIILGSAGRLHKGYCERLFRSLVAFLLRASVLEGESLSEDEEDDLHYFTAERERRASAGVAGILIALHEPGAWVQAGETLGDIYDRYDGGVRESIPALVSGLLTGVRCSGLVDRGDPLFCIQPRPPQSAGRGTGRR